MAEQKAPPRIWIRPSSAEYSTLPSNFDEDDIEYVRADTVRTAAPAAADVCCTLAGPGRGDCLHFVGLPGKSIPGQHDGPDDTVDAYGRPNGWCFYCWLSYRLEQLQAKLAAPAAPVCVKCGHARSLRVRGKCLRWESDADKPCECECEFPPSETLRAALAEIPKYSKRVSDGSAEARDYFEVVDVMRVVDQVLAAATQPEDETLATNRD